jgi:hypothetical protein
MTSSIDPTKPTDGVPSVKLDLRNNLQAAKTEIEALQAGKTDLGHQHLIGDLTDVGALAGKDQVEAGDIAPGAVGAAELQDGIPINMLDQQLSRPELKDFSEASTTPAVSAGTLTLDLEMGNVFEAILSEDVTTLTFANPPASGRAGTCSLILRQDATGGRTLAWPSSVRWAGGTPPLVTPAANTVDMYAFVTRDGGTTWYGFPGGQDFS